MAISRFLSWLDGLRKPQFSHQAIKPAGFLTSLHTESRQTELCSSSDTVINVSIYAYSGVARFITDYVTG
jgi:hypothetical protein